MNKKDNRCCASPVKKKAKPARAIRSHFSAIVGLLLRVFDWNVRWFYPGFPAGLTLFIPKTTPYREKNFFILQVQLYEDLAKFQVKKGLEETVSHMDEDNKNEEASKDNPHVFQVSIDFILSTIQRLFYLFNCEFDHGH